MTADDYTAIANSAHAPIVGDATIELLDATVLERGGTSVFGDHDGPAIFDDSVPDTSPAGLDLVDTSTLDAGDFGIMDKAGAGEDQFDNEQASGDSSTTAHPSVDAFTGFTDYESMSQNASSAIEDQTLTGQSRSSIATPAPLDLPLRSTVGCWS
jgi:hypothetical protein